MKYGEIKDPEILERIKRLRMMSESLQYVDFYILSQSLALKEKMMEVIQNENEKVNEIIAQKVKEIATSNEADVSKLKLKFDAQKNVIEVVSDDENQ